MSNIYNDSTYLNNNPSWHEEDAPFKVNKIIELIKRHPIQFKSVCEVGCGSGEILVQLANHFNDEIDYCGYDISLDAIQIAKKKETTNITFKHQNIAEVTSTYDLQLVMDVIEHVEDYFKFLDDIVNKASYTIFHIPLDMSLITLFRENKLIASKNRIGHIHNFTESFILSILEDKGFSVIGKMYTPPIFETMTVKQRMINTLRKVLFTINKKFASKAIGGYSILVLTKNNSTI